MEEINVFNNELLEHKLQQNQFTNIDHLLIDATSLDIFLEHCGHLFLAHDTCEQFSAELCSILLDLLLLDVQLRNPAPFQQFNYFNHGVVIANIANRCDRFVDASPLFDRVLLPYHLAHYINTSCFDDFNNTIKWLILASESDINFIMKNLVSIYKKNKEMIFELIPHFTESIKSLANTTIEREDRVFAVADAFNDVDFFDFIKHFETQPSFIEGFRSYMNNEKQLRASFVVNCNQRNFLNITKYFLEHKIINAEDFSITIIVNPARRFYYRCLVENGLFRFS